MTSRKIAPSGAGRRTTTGEYLILLLGGAGTEAPPDWSEGEGRGSTVPRPSLHLKVGFAPEDTERSVSGQVIALEEAGYAIVPVVQVTCEECGSRVEDPFTHRQWHFSWRKRMTELLDRKSGR